MDEAHSREAVAHELQRAFPSAPVDQVEILVECLWSHFDGAPVRDFVPLLVEKQAKEELLDHYGPRAEAEQAFIASQFLAAGRLESPVDPAVASDR